MCSISKREKPDSQGTIGKFAAPVACCTACNGLVTRVSSDMVIVLGKQRGVAIGSEGALPFSLKKNTLPAF